MENKNLLNFLCTSLLNSILNKMYISLCFVISLFSFIYVFSMSTALVTLAADNLEAHPSKLSVYIFDVLFSFAMFLCCFCFFVEIRSAVLKRGVFSKLRVVSYILCSFFTLIFFMGANSSESSALTTSVDIISFMGDFEWGANSDWLPMVQNYFFIFFMFFLFWWMLKKGKPANAFFIKVFFLIWVYVFCGILFSAAWALASIYNDESLSEVIKTSGDALYFSFVTMTTLGYGEIHPMVMATKTLAIVQSIFGVFFSSLLIGVAVGYTLNSVGVKVDTD
mgnify:CR=1 FL=1